LFPASKNKNPQKSFESVMIIRLSAKSYSNTSKYFNEKLTINLAQASCHGQWPGGLGATIDRPPTTD
jgi:hypothetical protein